MSCVSIHHVPAGHAAYQHRTVPSGCVELSCVIGDDTIMVTGPRQGPLIERLDAGARVIGVRLRTATASAILSAPASELVGLQVGLEHLWGRSAAALAARIAASDSPESAASLFEQAIARALPANTEPDMLVVEAVRRLQCGHSVRVADLAAELFISRRQLRRRFHAALGLGPTTLTRILHFRRFLALSNETGDETSLARLAFTARYADQAHLTRECVRLSGLTPRLFLDEVSKSCDGTHDHIRERLTV